MVHALGYSIDAFNPAEPGRLCRGRERWIQSWTLDAPETLHRVMISGASFSDETARDAQRGLSYSGAGLGEILAAIVANGRVVASCEDGHPRRIPPGAFQVEDYALRRPFGPLQEWRVRWFLDCPDAETADAAVEAGADLFVVLDPADPGTALPEELVQAVYLLHGHRAEGQPERRFQPAAVPVVLAYARAAALVHLDKHGPSLGLYARDPLDVADALHAIASKAQSLTVPFAIPPMLARWDRALWELRQDWDEAQNGPFPVPPAPEPDPHWRGRRRTRGEE